MAGSYDFEEQERIAAIHHWWEDNAKFVFVAVAVFLLSVAGWRGWQYWSGRAAGRRRGHGQRTRQGARQREEDGRHRAAIIDKYPRTFFASEAALVSAQSSFEAGDLAAPSRASSG